MFIRIKYIYIHEENHVVIPTMVAEVKVLEMKSSFWGLEENNKSRVPTIYHAIKMCKTVPWNQPHYMREPNKM